MNFGKLEIEKAYLGTIITNGGDSELYGITEDYFIDGENRIIFRAIYELYKEGVIPDLISISDKLDSYGVVEVGNIAINVGAPKLIELTNGDFYSSNRQYYADLLKAENKRVSLYKVWRKIGTVIESEGKINGNIFDMAKEIIDLDTLSEGRYDLGDDIEEAMNTLEFNRGKDMLGPSFGNSYLDNYTKGFRPGKVYRLGAESNLGKSWLAYGIVNELLEQNKKVIFFTLENDKTTTITNLIANHMGVNPYLLESLEVEPDFGRLDSKKHLLKIIDDSHDLGEIFSRTLQIKPDIVVLDFIGLVDMKGIEADAHYTPYAKQVQQFSKRENITWLDLSNLPISSTPALMKSGGHFYGSSFLRNSNDVGIHMWYYEDYYKWRDRVFEMGATEEQKNALKSIQVVQICITKNRYGKKGFEEVFKINWDKGGRYIKATEEELNTWRNAII